MSHANVKLVQAVLAAFAGTGEPIWQALHPEIEVHDHDIMDASDYRGHAGVRRWFDDWAAAWSEYTMEPEEFIDAGHHVVVFALQRTTGHDSGVTLERHAGMVFEVEDAKLVRVDHYNNRDAALKQVGLEE